MVSRIGLPSPRSRNQISQRSVQPPGTREVLQTHHGTGIFTCIFTIIDPIQNQTCRSIYQTWILRGIYIYVLSEKTDMICLYPWGTHLVESNTCEKFVSFFGSNFLNHQQDPKSPVSPKKWSWGVFSYVRLQTTFAFFLRTLCGTFRGFPSKLLLRPTLV